LGAFCAFADNRSAYDRIARFAVFTAFSRWVANNLRTFRLSHLVKDTPAVKLARMSFLDLIGDDTDIKSYWDKVKNRDIEEKEDF